MFSYCCDLLAHPLQLCKCEPKLLFTSSCKKKTKRKTTPSHGVPTQRQPPTSVDRAKYCHATTVVLSAHQAHSMWTPAVLLLSCTQRVSFVSDCIYLWLSRGITKDKSETTYRSHDTHAKVMMPAAHDQSCHSVRIQHRKRREG